MGHYRRLGDAHLPSALDPTTEVRATISIDFQCYERPEPNASKERAMLISMLINVVRALAKRTHRA